MLNKLLYTKKKKFNLPKQNSMYMEKKYMQDVKMET